MDKGHGTFLKTYKALSAKTVKKKYSPQKKHATLHNVILMNWTANEMKQSKEKERRLEKGHK